MSKIFSSKRKKLNRRSSITLILFLKDQKVEVKPQISLNKYKLMKMQLDRYTEVSVIVCKKGKITREFYSAYLGRSVQRKIVGFILLTSSPARLS